MTILPTGTVTFLVTDVEGSTARWKQQPQAVRVAVSCHLGPLRTVGDGVRVAVVDTGEAVAARLAAQCHSRKVPEST